jgi:trimeric autotransporter adhesin
MKKILFLAVILSLSALCSLLGQTTKKSLNYQAVILDPKAIDIPGASLSGQPLSKGKVCLKFTFVNAQGNVDYEETQQTTTDEYGLVSISVGTGTYNAGTFRSFESIVWDANVKSMKVAVSYDGCNSFKQVSTQALNYTPYALYAEAVDYKNVKDAPTKLSQFSNDAGYLIPKDLDPIKADIKKNTEDIKTNTADIQTNTADIKTNTADIKTNTADINTNAVQIASANQTIAENKKASDDSFLIVKQSISDLGIKVISNTNSIVTIEGKINEQQNLINDTRNQLNSTTSSINGQINGLQNQVNTTANTVNTLIGDAQIVANKSTATNLGGASPSDILYPSQKAAKTYVDNAIYNAVGTGVADATTLAPGKVQLAGDLAGTATAPTVPGLANKENLSNKSTSTSLGTSNDLYPSQNAVKVYVDQATQGIALQAAVDAKADKNSPVFTGTPNLPTGTIAVTQNPGDNTTNIATTAFVQQATAAGIIDASSTTKGKLKLAGDLGGTAESPTVPGLALKANTADVTSSLALKEDASNKSTATALGTSDALYPSQKAVKTYVDAQIASATIADADPSTKGKIQLAGDLGGTAAAPTVPGLALKAPINNPTFTGTVAGITQGMVGLSNVNNTSDANKPVSTAAQTALDLKAPIASPTFTGTVSGISKSMVGLANVDNTSDANKPVSTATQTALDLKAPLASPTFTGTPSLPTGTTGVTQLANDNSTKLATTEFVTTSLAAGAPDATTTATGKVQLAGDLGGTAAAPTVPGLALKANTTDVNSSLALKAPINNPTFTGTVGGITQSMVGLGNVDNTSDANKPVSTATQTALDLKAPLASPTFTGTPSLPTGTTAITQSAGDNSTKLATTEFVTTKLASGAPDATTTATGKIQLAGDLGGTASSPTVPGLALKANTTDVNSSLALKAPINNPTFTGTVGGITNSMVGLGNVDNTSDANKPVSTATQTALDLKAPIASPTFTGTPSLPTGTTAITQSAGDNSTKLATTEFVTTKLASGAPDATTTATGKIQLAGDLGGTASAPTVPGLALKANTTDVNTSLALKAPINNPTFTGTVGGITTSMVGLGNVDNTSDANKPVSTATQTALDLKAPLASPTFTGDAKAVTATAGDNDVSIATTEFVTSAVTTATPTNYVTTNTAQTITASKTFSSSATATNNLALGTIFSPTLTATANNDILVGVDINPTFTNGAFTPVANYGLRVQGIHIGRGGGNLSFNLAVGSSALFRNTAGNTNVAIGNNSLGQNTVGNNNTAIGNNTLSGNTVGNFNTAIGNSADVDSNNLTNATALGYGAKVSASNTIQLGADGTFGTVAITNVKTSGTLTAGTVTYPNAPGNPGQVLTINDDQIVQWRTPPFVDLTTNQTVAGAKTFSSDLTVNEIKVGRGGGNQSGNTAIGISALSNNSGGDGNTASGSSALFNNTEGNSNTANGWRALYLNTTGNNNTVSGYQALLFNADGISNTAIGYRAGRKIADDSDNNTTSDFSVYLGSETKASADDAQNEIVIGYNAIGAGSNTIQLGNTDVTNVKTSGTVNAAGYTATVVNGNSVSTASFGVAGLTTPGTLTAGTVTYPNVPGDPGQVLTIDNAGTATWAAAAGGGVPYTGATQEVNLGLFDLTVNEIKVGKGGGNAANNTALGYSALMSNTTGDYNTASGHSSLASNTTGGNNTAIGYYALGYNEEGSNNIAIGSSALQSNKNGSGNTAIGNYTNVGFNNLTNATAIGYGARVSASNTIQLGADGTTSDVNGYIPAITDVKTSGTLTAGTVTYPKLHGTANQVLSTTGSGTLTWVTPASAGFTFEVSDEFTATGSEASFTLSNTPAANSKVKMYINGIRISNSAYSISGTTLTYDSTNNGNYTISVGDRIQFDFSY